MDVDPSCGELLDEHFGPPDRLGAVGEDGGPFVLVFDGPFLSRVLVGEDVVAVGVLQLSSPAFLCGVLLTLDAGHGHHIPNL